MNWTTGMTLSVHCRHNNVSLVLICVLAGGGCERTETTAQSGIQTVQAVTSEAIAGPPLKAVESMPSPAEKPLLLLDDSQDGESAGGPSADNSRCFVCHVNYMQEQLATFHAKANIGCAGCHGASDAHIADESWGSGGNGTAPDIMYPRDKIDPSCMTCHPKDKINVPQHEPVFARSNAKICTDCHGSHRLPQRRCKWR